MALKQRKFETEIVVAIAAGVCEDLDPKHGPDGGYWFVREGSRWKSTARIVELQPAWFCEDGTDEITARFVPDSQFVPSAGE
jgi:hypothetical protein